jgi:hypothetical protein
MKNVLKQLESYKMLLKYYPKDKIRYTKIINNLNSLLEPHWEEIRDLQINKIINDVAFISS